MSRRAPAMSPKTMSRNPRFAMLLPLAVLSTALVASAQAPDRHGIFLDTIDVNIINIEVMAFDRDGNPVTSLTREDFELYEDGKQIEISNFFAIENGIRVIEAAATPGTAPSRTAPQRSASEQRNIVLFIDNGNITTVNRKRVFSDLRANLERLMEPADRVMVVRQDGEVRIEQPFTSDPGLIAATLDRLEHTAGQGSLRELEPRLIQRAIESASAPAGTDTLASGSSPTGAAGAFQQRTDDIDARSTYSRVTAFAQSTQVYMRQTMAALGRFVESLAGLPGRKAIIYVSDGLELKPAEYLFRLWDFKYNRIANQAVGVPNIDAEIQHYRVDGEFEELIATANANRVAFYTVEGGSQRGFGDISAEQRTALVDPVSRTTDGDREESLRALAFETGGVPMLNDAGIVSLVAQLEQDFNSYYSLGYPSPHSGDGKYHRVEVRVRREGIKLRYLEGYQDKSADDRMSDLTLAALLHDVGDNPLEVQVEIGDRHQKGDKGYVVPLVVKVPLSRLVLIPQDDAYLGRLSIFLAVRDEQGRLLAPRKIDVPVRIPDSQLLAALTQMAGYTAQLQMRPGDQKIAIGVRDELASVSSTLNLSLRVGDI